MTNYTIQVVSDTVCPWCYVGHKRLSYAIRKHVQSYPDDTFTTVFKPYQLNPNGPKVGIDKQEFYRTRFGAAQIEPMFRRLRAVGEQDGIAFKFGGKTGNTRDSHRLIQAAKTLEDAGSPGLQKQLVETLFRGYFEEEKDITSREMLESAGVSAGMDAAVVKRVLESDEGGAVVDREAAEARDKGVNGVPHFEINGRYVVEGAQDPQAFERLFRQIRDGTADVEAEPY